MDNNLLRLAARNLRYINRTKHKVFDKLVGDMGIHHSQHMTLMFIGRHGGINSQKEISEEFEISPAAVAVTLKKMEKSGYIERSSDQQDGRFNRITVTKKGKSIIEQTKVCFDEADRKMFAGFTEEEMQDFVSLLERVKANIIKMDQETNGKDDVN